MIIDDIILLYVHRQLAATIQSRRRRCQSENSVIASTAAAVSWSLANVLALPLFVYYFILLLLLLWFYCFLSSSSSLALRNITASRTGSPLSYYVSYLYI